MAFTANNAKTASGDNLVVLNLPLGLEFFDLSGLFFFRQIRIGLNVINMLIDAAAQHDIGTAASHIGCNRHHAGAACFQHNLSFTFVLLSVEHIVLNAFLVEQFAQGFRVFNGSCAQQNRLLTFVAFLDVFNDRLIFFIDRAENLILLVITDHLLMRRDNNRFQPINILEFVSFRVRRTRHTRQLLIHTEVVLEGNGGKSLVFLIDLDAFFGFNGLMQTFRPTAARHQTAGEFINDDDFTILHNVMLVALKERMRSQRSHQMVHQNNVLTGVKALPLRNQTAFGQDFFDVFVTFFRDVDLMGLFVDPVVALTFFGRLSR